MPLAFLAALRRHRPADLLIRGAFQVGLSTPVFYLGLVLLDRLRRLLRWFPVGGYGDTWSDRLYSLFLPALTLALSLSAVLMRNLRAVDHRGAGRGVCRLRARQGPAAAARAVPARAAQRADLDRDAVRPQIGTLLGGAVITETVFAIPGVGRLMIESIYGRDYPVVQGLTLVLAVLVSLVFLLTDLVQAALDPRVGR